MTDEEITKLARAILREQEFEALRRAREECLSEDAAIAAYCHCYPSTVGAPP